MQHERGNPGWDLPFMTRKEHYHKANTDEGAKCKQQTLVSPSPRPVLSHSAQYLCEQVSAEGRRDDLFYDVA
jgi:hypothetical protein